MPLLLYKKIGETPLEALNRLRIERSDLKEERLSYAGRLDPLAEGLLLVLVGEECDENRRQEFLGLKKEYEVEVLFGFSTDSFDLMGLPIKGNLKVDNLSLKVEEILPKFIGNNHELKYPPFSSKTIKGKALFELARAGEKIDLPPIKGKVSKIHLIDSKTISTSDLLSHIHNVISLVKGDFRQDEILKEWELNLKTEADWSILKIQVQCESGVYMRSLAEALGQKLGCGALAFSIRRTKIGDYGLK